ncbi:hypothetical protein POM88_033838 [Heracleum sosnowskyi]|uniref:Membrane transporter protein n=1 Tax=Heracleum sosnowskyi TaxID=360622 RepID=A0AAD8HI84_9APIA|nr:hypothetical protein POM88_033838 [Heracleum sosnowskyi]
MAGLGKKWKKFQITSCYFVELFFSFGFCFRREKLKTRGKWNFNWRIVVASIIGFCGAAFGSVGGIGGDGIFVPMITLVIGFDPKSATAISKLEMPIIDYDLALLIQPMLMLGISFGVTLNVLFADWMVTVLLIVLFLGSSTMAFLKGVDTWKGETILKKLIKLRMLSRLGHFLI